MLFRSRSLLFFDHPLKFDITTGLWLQIFLSFVVSLGPMSDGLGVNWLSSKIEEFQNANGTMKMTLGQASTLGTLPVYTSMCSIPFTVYSTNLIGRKWTLMWGTFLTFISYIILAVSDKIEFLYLGSAFRGLGGSNIYTVSQIYIAEISETKIRGLLGSFVPILMNLGILTGYIWAMLFDLKSLIIFGTIISGLMFPCFIFAPRSPFYLFSKHKQDDAEKSLIRLRDKKSEILSELEIIKTTVEQDNLEKINICEFFLNRKNIKILFIVLMVQVFQQLSGVDAILLYLQIILKSANNDSLSPELSSVIFGSGKLLSCITALILIDKLGRKPLLIISCFSTSCVLCLLGGYFYAKDVLHYDLSSLSVVPTILLFIYILCYNVGLGVVPFILGSEMFPTKYKSLGVNANQIAYAVSMLTATQIVASLKDSYGFYAAFFALAILTFIGCLFSIFCIIETKKKTFIQILEEI